MNLPVLLPDCFSRNERDDAKLRSSWACASSLADDISVNRASCRNDALLMNLFFVRVLRSRNSRLRYLSHQRTGENAGTI